MTVLLVEDDPAILEMMRRRLSLRGFAVVAATDGETAVTLALELRPDAILMDAGLPGISGWEATARIRAVARGAHLPIFAVTAHATPADAERARVAGCDAFFSKPVDFANLVERLRAITPAYDAVPGHGAAA
jgi:two-component system, cell cycle response regulator DivK